MSESTEHNSQRELLLRRLADGEQTTIASARIPRRISDGPVELTPSQMAIWLDEQMRDPSPLYNLPAAFRIRGMVDVDSLRTGDCQLNGGSGLA